MKKALGAFILACTLTITVASCAVPEDDGSTAADQSEANTKKGGKADSDKSEESKPEAPKESAGQENAREAAENYLDLKPFSREGLIEQLKFEDYSLKDATYGVEAQKADWNKQAAASAQDYLDMTSFSRQGLIDQLKFEGYTQEQAEYGVKRVGL
jgi:Host cell surface-exposed lipoprotein